MGAVQFPNQKSASDREILEEEITNEQVLAVAQELARLHKRNTGMCFNYALPEHYHVDVSAIYPSTVYEMARETSRCMPWCAVSVTIDGIDYCFKKGELHHQFNPGKLHLVYSEENLEI